METKQILRSSCVWLTWSSVPSNTGVRPVGGAVTFARLSSVLIRRPKKLPYVVQPCRRCRIGELGGGSPRKKAAQTHSWWSRQRLGFFESVPRVSEVAAAVVINHEGWDAYVWMPDDDDGWEGDAAGMDSSGCLVETISGGEGDLYGTRGYGIGGVRNHYASGLARSGGHCGRSDVNCECSACELETAVVHRFRTDVGLKLDEVGDSWMEIRGSVRALLHSTRAV